MRPWIALLLALSAPALAKRKPEPPEAVAEVQATKMPTVEPSVVPLLTHLDDRRGCGTMSENWR